MKLYVIDNGRIVMRESNGVTADSPSIEPASIPIHCFLIESEGQFVLFDTGCDPDGFAKNWPDSLRGNPHVFSPEQQLASQLNTLGLRPGDIGCVVLSHLHVDHAGGLGLFPGARAIVGEAEFTKTMRAYAEHALPPFYVASDVEHWLRAEIRWELLAAGESRKVCEGVTAINFGPGHAHNMLALLVETDQSGKFLLVSDAVYTDAHYADPELLAGIVRDAAGYVNTVKAIRALAERLGANVLFGHDTRQFAELVKLPDCYQ